MATNVSCAISFVDPQATATDEMGDEPIVRQQGGGHHLS